MQILKCKIGKINVISGNGAMLNLISELKQMKIRKPMIVTEDFFLKSSFYKCFFSEFQTIEGEVYLYTSVTPNPKDYEVMHGAEEYRQAGCDAVIAIGGGSIMDAGKAISFMVRHEGDVIDYARSTKDNKREFTYEREPLICIPTTSGTGSEISPHAMIYNTNTNKKCNVTDASLYCDLVVLEPGLTFTLPRTVTIESGVDALCHAIEVYTDKKAVNSFTPFHDALALKSISLIAENLEKACESDGQNIEVRENMMWASFLAGIVLDLDVNCCHGLAGVLQTYYHDISHGVSVGTLLPSVMEFNLKSCPERFKDIAIAMGETVVNLNDLEAAERSIIAVRKLLRTIKFPRLSDYIHGTDEVDKFYKIGASSSCNTNNPKYVSEEDAKIIYLNAIKDTYI